MTDVYDFEDTDPEAAGNDDASIPSYKSTSSSLIDKNKVNTNESTPGSSENKEIENVNDENSSNKNASTSVDKNLKTDESTSSKGIINIHSLKNLCSFFIFIILVDKVEKLVFFISFY